MIPSSASFIGAVLDPFRDVPKGLRIAGDDIKKRFAIYRNNVTASLVEALAAAFPVVKKLVGEEFFEAMATVFARQHPPSSPLLMYYGHQMPAFLHDFEPVKHLPFLADVATLEIELRTSYHAEDGKEFDPRPLISLPADELMMSKIEFNAPVKILSSQYPIYSIWMANMHNGPKPRMDAESLIITRPEFDPRIRELNAGEYEFLQALGEEMTIGRAADMSFVREGEFDVQGLFQFLIAEKAIKKILKP